jgi:outer membrane protein assembly factor BamB
MRRLRSPQTGALLGAALLGTALLGTALAGAPQVAGAAGPTDWTGYLHGPAHSSAAFNDGAITPANAGALRRAWHFDADPATQPGQPGPRLDASPTVAGGLVYLGARTGMFYALNVTTGAVVWKRQLGFGGGPTCPAKGIIGTATVAPDPVDGVSTVYAPGAHLLYALNAATGAVRWKRAIGPNTAAGAALYLNWASPTVAGGRIFMGLAASCEASLIRGGVVSIDQHTGALQHTWFATPAGTVGASVWSSVASDGTSVWVTTGNPDPNGAAVFDAYSIVRLDAATMTRQDRWTAPLAQNIDFDFGSSPTLLTAALAGVVTPLVAACNKNGLLYAWRRADLAAGPIWQRRLGVSGAGGLSCITSPAFDGTAGRLIAAANASTIAGSSVPGAVRARRGALAAAAALRRDGQPDGECAHPRGGGADLRLCHRNDAIGPAVRRDHRSGTGHAGRHRQRVRSTGVRRRPDLRRLRDRWDERVHALTDQVSSPPKPSRPEAQPAGPRKAGSSAQARAAARLPGLVASHHGQIPPWSVAEELK